MVCLQRIILLFVLVDISIAAIFNGSFLDELDNGLNIHKKNLLSGRRQWKKNKKHRSTSSSSGDIKKEASSKVRRSSLELSDTVSSASSLENVVKKKKGKHKPKSSKERKGWRKWHRKCTPCPADMVLKWKDPRNKWICGAYQSARRSFKSLCMMHYRNCQDGTMFTKIAEHRCQNETDQTNHGEHFFYDYQVDLSGDSSSSSGSKKSDSSASSSSSSSSDSWDTEKIEELKKNNQINVNAEE